MIINTYKMAKHIDTPHKVKVGKLHDSEHAQVVHITLEPGESLIRHITPVDVVFYVLEGRGIVDVGEESLEVTRDTLIESPKNIPHCWHNQSESTLRILVIKTPRPTESSKLL